MEAWFAKYESSKDFITLDAWKKARSVRMFFYSEIISTLPSEEKYNLGAQIRRASVSVTANISEGYGRFHYQEGIQHYRIARGSLYELKDHLISCLDLQYIDDSLFDKGIDLIERAKVKLNGFIKFIEAKQKNGMNRTHPYTIFPYTLYRPYTRILHSTQYLRCFTVIPLLINCFSESIPIFKCVSTNCFVTAMSLTSVFTPSGTIG